MPSTILGAEGTAGNETNSLHSCHLNFRDTKGKRKAQVRHLRSEVSAKKEDGTGRGHRQRLGLLCREGVSRGLRPGGQVGAGRRSSIWREHLLEEGAQGEVAGAGRRGASWAMARVLDFILRATGKPQGGLSRRDLI